MQRPFPISRRQLAAMCLAASAMLLAACGGGGDGAAAGYLQATESATAYAAGPISGFGSVIVNGVRYDDSAATVLDDDGGGHGRDSLKLGMMVEIDGTQMNRAAALGKALRIRFGSEIVGPVDGIDAAAGSLVVLGQTVLTTATTVFDDSLAGGLGAIATGTVIEVHALFDAASGRYVATRIEAEPGAAFYQLRGVIAKLDTTGKTFELGGLVIAYAGLAVADLPAALANGQRVRVRLQTVPRAGQWIAVAIQPGLRKLENRDEAHVRGAVTAYTSSATFAVNGLPVDASGAAFPDGSAGVALGVQVEVEGKLVEGVLVASKVELDARHASERHRLELHGSISGLDTAAGTFMLRGVRVSYGTATQFKNGSVANLADGRQVEVKGMPSADRASLVASVIDFES